MRYVEKASYSMKKLQNILVIDDEQSFGKMLCTVLAKDGYHAAYQGDAKQALVTLSKGDYDVVLCDINMPNMTGLEFLKALKEDGKIPTIVMMSAYGSLDTALECMKLGVYDYMSKPFKSDELILTLRKIEEREGLRRENKQLRKQLERTSAPEGFIGASPVIQRLTATIKKVADYKSTVLITGESGTGKEVVARAIHRQSPRASAPFVAVNCGAIPDQLLESELFGHVRGAFTDASRDKKGMFAEADGGTLFLDEIGEMPMNLQVKLLRAIQEEEIRRVGESRTTSIDVRIIAATIRDLQQDVSDRRFREDLYYRLNVLPLRIPPLRDRSEDIPLLVDHFMKRSSVRLGKRIQAIQPEALTLLSNYPWPGNVRELENTIERAGVFAESDTITSDVLPENIVESTNRIRLTLDRGELSIKKTTRLIEEDLITRALTKTGGNRTAAAKLLEISHRALLYKIKEYGVAIPPR